MCSFPMVSLARCVVTYFAHAQHTRRFAGCRLFSKLLEEPRTVRCSLPHPQKNNKLYVATKFITCIHLFVLFDVFVQLF